MKMETMGMVAAGELKLDNRLDLPDGTRVNVVVESLDDWRPRFRVGLESWLAFCEEHPIHAGGKRFSREDLHESA